MYKKLKLKPFFLIIAFLFIASCGNSKNDNFDFSNIELPKKSNKNIKEEEVEIIAKEEIINKLLPLKNRDEVTKLIQYGKEDPFSPFSDNSKKFISNFSLKGFITVENLDNAIINYLGKDGVINIDSVGGKNTNLLPNNAYVKDINPLNEELIIVIENEIYTLKIDDN